jgi:hypothetical protein
MRRTLDLPAGLVCADNRPIALPLPCMGFAVFVLPCFLLRGENPQKQNALFSIRGYDIILLFSLVVSPSDA